MLCPDFRPDFRMLESTRLLLGPLERRPQLGRESLEAPTQDSPVNVDEGAASTAAVMRRSRPPSLPDQHGRRE